MADLAKRALTWPATLTVAGTVMRMYRRFALSTMFVEHDLDLIRFLKSRAPAIFTVWHQDFVMTLGYLSQWNPERKTYALASASRDGGIATAVAIGMGYQRPIRGSSARGGQRALLELTRRLRDERGASLAVVVDGPRPPAREMKPGAVHLASQTGRPIWLLRSTASPQRIARRSWAQFHLPLPFSRVAVGAEGPIHVPRGLDRAGVETWRADLEARMNALADRTDVRAAALTAR